MARQRFTQSHHSTDRPCGFQAFSLSAIMIKLLSIVIVAGLAFGQEEKPLNMSNEVDRTENSRSRLPHPLFPDKPVCHTVPSLPVGSGNPCYHAVNTKCWTDWFNRDNPSGSGDWEELSRLHIENPGKICPNPTGIQAETLSGVSAAVAGDTIFLNNPSLGFVCRNTDQYRRMCNNYRVRFVCYPPFCGGGVCWTKWYDRDNASGKGDYETLSDLRRENPGEICECPLYIEAVTTDTSTPASNTGQTFKSFNPSQGLVCINRDQKCGQCKDYKVRFGCPCEH